MISTGFQKVWCSIQERTSHEFGFGNGVFNGGSVHNEIDQIETRLIRWQFRHASSDILFMTLYDRRAVLSSITNPWS